MSANHDTNPKRNPRRVKGAGSSKTDPRQEGPIENIGSSAENQESFTCLNNARMIDAALAYQPGENVAI